MQDLGYHLPAPLIPGKTKPCFIETIDDMAGTGALRRALSKEKTIVILIRLLVLNNEFQYLPY